MTHEDNEFVKETKTLALIQKYESFKMEEDENIEETFSRLQTLVAGLRVLNKGYTTIDLVKKIIKGLPQKWRHMVTALKVSRDLNSTTLEELISSLRSHEIELEADEPQKKAKSVALNSSCEFEKVHISHSMWMRFSPKMLKMRKCLYSSEESINFGNTDKGESEPSTKLVDEENLHPTRESQKQIEKLSVMNVKNLVTTEVSAPNSMMKNQRTSFLRRRFLWLLGMLQW
jgi:hypothetical protein